MATETCTNCEGSGTVVVVKRCRCCGGHGERDAASAITLEMLREARRDAKISVRAMGRVLGVSGARVSEIQSGRGINVHGAKYREISEAWMAYCEAVQLANVVAAQEEADRQ